MGKLVQEVLGEIVEIVVEVVVVEVHMYLLKMVRNIMGQNVEGDAEDALVEFVVEDTLVELVADILVELAEDILLELVENIF